MTLVEFLLARIAEDERTFEGGLGDYYENDHAERMLLEISVKRKIVESCRADYEYAQGRNDDDTTELAEEILWHLAAVYDDHSDYRDEWRADA